MQVVKVAAWMVGLSLVVLVAGYAWGRLRPSTEAQTQAMALLKPEPRLTSATNAWATFWLLDYDIPAAQTDAAYAQERAHLEAWARRTQADKSPSVGYVSRAGETFPKRPTISAAQAKLLCYPADSDCIGKVRANLPLLRELLAGQAGRLAQLRAIPSDAVLWDDTPLMVNSPLPDLGMPGNLRLTAAALDFVDGRKVQALAQVCRDARTVRHLHAHTNSLIGAMVANSWMDSIERLLAGMLTELPADQPLPKDCAVAFAPVTRADVDMCVPLQREYQGLQTVTANVLPDKTHRLRLQLLFDIKHSRRLSAPTYAWACQPAVIERMVGDRPLSSVQMPRVHHDLFDKLSNPIGMILAQIAAPDVTKYLNRNEDFAASLRVTRFLLATRGTAATADAWQQQLTAARPTLRQQGSRLFQLDAAGHQLVMPYSAPSQRRRELILPLSK